MKKPKASLANRAARVRCSAWLDRIISVVVSKSIVLLPPLPKWQWLSKFCGRSRARSSAASRPGASASQALQPSETVIRDSNPRSTQPIARRSYCEPSPDTLQTGQMLSYLDDVAARSDRYRRFQIGEVSPRVAASDLSDPAYLAIIDVPLVISCCRILLAMQSNARTEPQPLATRSRLQPQRCDCQSWSN